MLFGSDANNNMLRDVTRVKMRRDSRFRGTLGQAIGHKAVIGANKAVIPSPPAAHLPLSIDGRRIRT
jgi:hypothetical protein